MDKIIDINNLHKDLLDLTEQDRHSAIKGLLKTLKDTYQVEGIDKIKKEQTRLLNELHELGISYIPDDGDL